MADKSVVGRKVKPKGRTYCDTPGTACTYNENDVCVHCDRPKGWRQQAKLPMKNLREALYAINRARGEEEDKGDDCNTELYDELNAVQDSIVGILKQHDPDWQD